jgi:hypothetical protein
MLMLFCEMLSLHPFHRLLNVLMPRQHVPYQRASGLSLYLPCRSQTYMTPQKIRCWRQTISLPRLLKMPMYKPAEALPQHLIPPPQPLNLNLSRQPNYPDPKC